MIEIYLFTRFSFLLYTMFILSGIQIPVKTDYSFIESVLPYISEYKRSIYLENPDNINIHHRIYSDILILYFLHQEYKIPISDIIIEYNQLGKPEVLSHPDTHFSISHTSNIILIASSPKQTGLDFEKIRKRNQEKGLVNRYFSPAEILYYNSLEDSDKTNYFYKIWTLKEAYLKALGIGIRIPLNSLNFQLKNKQIISLEHEQAMDFQFITFNHLEYCVSLATKFSAELPDNIDFLEFEDFKKQVLISLLNN